MKKKLWKYFIKVIWPLIWPHVRDLIIKVAEDVGEWIYSSLKKLFSKARRSTDNFAKKKESEAASNAERATTGEEKARAEGEASAWRQIRQKLEEENDSLREQLGQLRFKFNAHIAARTDEIARLENTEMKILSLTPPPTMTIKDRS